MVKITNPLGSQDDGALPLGGVGSGNWGHVGRPGQRGGSSKGGSYQIGVTSARPDKPDAQTVNEMVGFQAAMKGTPVTDLSVDVGRGGWKGGHEVTFVTQYRGNGEAIKALAKYGKAEDQDAVLIQRYTSDRDPDAQPQNRLTFNKVFDLQAVEAMEGLVADAGFEGWTWFNKGGQTTLMLVCIPQWGGEKSAHLASVKALEQVFEGAGLGFVREDRAVAVDLMTHDNYDEYLK